MVTRHQPSPTATAVQGIPPVLCGLDRTWSRDSATQPPTSPVLLYSLSSLEEQLKAAYKLVTEGKFSDALKVFIRMLQIVPLMVVETRKEVDEVRSVRPAAFCCPRSRGVSRLVQVLCTPFSRPLVLFKLKAWCLRVGDGLSSLHLLVTPKPAAVLFAALPTVDVCRICCRR